METGNGPVENALFSNVDATRTVLPSGYPVDETTSANKYVAKLNAVNGSKIGPSLVLRVMAGDTVRIGVRAFYKSIGAKISQAPVASMLAALAQALDGSGGRTAPHVISVADAQLVAPLNMAQYNELKEKDPLQNLSDKPKAYLNYALFDDQFKMVNENSGIRQVQGAADELQTLSVNKAVVTKSGFLYIYTSNESGEDVYFDNLVVAQSAGPLLEETHYYPFGLTMKGISPKAVGSLTNKYGFNGKEKQNEEFSDGSGLELYDFHARNYDPQIGRWLNPDPLADQSPAVSPFVFVMNNPVLIIDPDGRTISGDTAIVAKLEEAAGKIVKDEEAAQARLQAQIDEAFANGKSTEELENKLQRSKERANEVTSLMSDIASLRTSPREYHITSKWKAPAGSGISGETVYNAKTGAIDVNISKSYGLPGLAHELAHASQFDKGLTDFNKDGINRGFLHDITDEQSAYRRQFAISGNMDGISKMSDITDSWIRSLNNQYRTLPAVGVDKNTTLGILFMLHKVVNPNITYQPAGGDIGKTYADTKNTIFNAFISR